MPAAPPAPHELIDTAKRQLGVTTNVDLWRVLGLDLANVHQRMKRIRAGGDLHYREAWALLVTLGYASEAPRPIDMAEQMVRRLDAGERIPARDLERVATAVERVAADLPHLAARLRAGVRGAQLAQ